VVVGTKLFLSLVWFLVCFAHSRVARLLMSYSIPRLSFGPHRLFRS
jgi:hypothetical protein